MRNCLCSRSTEFAPRSGSICGYKTVTLSGHVVRETVKTNAERVIEEAGRGGSGSESDRGVAFIAQG